ncbi:MAG: glycoside hydrolase family 26 protein [Lachnospiraceae bacterium]|nr:glycoside hydrolase family 26 protein [Lachnospiraceae bacterium]
MMDNVLMRQLKRVDKSIKARRMGVVSMLLLVFVALFLLVFDGVQNPFWVIRSDSPRQIISAFRNGADYVHVDGMDLYYSGYYKKDDTKGMYYNGYTFQMGGEEFFVFLPSEVEGSIGQPKDIVENISFIGTMSTDEQLFEEVAKDYGLSPDKFKKVYGMSGIVVQQADVRWRQTFILWTALLTIVLVFMGYQLFVLVGLLRYRRGLLGGKEEELAKGYRQISNG